MYTGGSKKDKRDIRDYRISGIGAPVELPESYRLNDPFPIKDQNGFGSCTGQATAGHKQLQEGVEISARFAYAMTKKYEGNKEWGAYTRNQFVVLKETGSVPEGAWPEKHDITEDLYMSWEIIPPYIVEDAALHKSSKYWRVEPNFESIKQAIYQYKQAVVISVPWYESYRRPKDGYLLLDKALGWKYGHAILVVGWQKWNLVVKNSWGEQWGLNGMCYFHFSLPIWDAWTSLDMPEKLPVEIRYGQARNYPMEKVTAFNPWLIRKIKRLPSNIEINALWYGKWDFEAVFKGRVSDQWLYEVKSK